MSHFINRANVSKRDHTVTLRCLALPSGDAEIVGEVEIIYGEGTAHTDLTDSDFFVRLLDHFKLFEDPEHNGCSDFLLTVSLLDPSEGLKVFE